MFINCKSMNSISLSSMNFECKPYFILIADERSIKVQTKREKKNNNDPVANIRLALAKGIADSWTRCIPFTINKIMDFAIWNCIRHKKNLQIDTWNS